MFLRFILSLLFCAAAAGRLQAQSLWHKVLDSNRITVAAMTCWGEEECVIVGSYSLFANLHQPYIGFTTDGGQSWQRAELKTAAEESEAQNVMLRSVVAVTPFRWFAVGGGNLAFRSTDGGRNWEPLEIGEKEIYYHLSFADSATGFAASPVQGKIFRTRDAGASWESVRITDPKFTTIEPILQDIEAVAPDTIYALRGDIGAPVMNPGFFRTVDGGNSWEEFALQSEEYSDNGARIRIFDILFLDAKRGYAAGRLDTADGGPYHTLILATEDGGRSWRKSLDTVFPDGPTYEIRKLFAVAPDVIIGVTDNGRVLVTTDGGKEWEGTAPSPFTGPGEFESDLYSAAFFSGPDVGYVADGFRRIWKYAPSSSVKEQREESAATANRLRLRHNPVRGSTLGLALQGCPATTITLHDVLGREISRHPIGLEMQERGYMELDVSLLANGLYILRAQEEEGKTESLPFLVER